jgi:hypothetical protein
MNVFKNAFIFCSLRFDIFIYRLWFNRWGHRIAQDEMLRHTLLGWLLSNEAQNQQMQQPSPSNLIH